MPEPLVSIIVTNHNYAAYLPEALDSALAQTHPRVEVVVVDDGSTDGSHDVIERYRTRVVVATTHGSRGQTAAMNIGFARSTGRVIVFLDADDVLDATAAAEAASRLRDDKLSKVHWPLREIDSLGAELGGVRPGRKLGHGDVRRTLVEEGPDAISFPPTSGNAWPRPLLDAVMPLPEIESACGVGSAGADALLSLVAAATGPVAALQQPLGSYRLHGRNDYEGLPIGAKARRHVALAEHHYATLGRYFDRLGLQLPVDRWRRSSWFHRVDGVVRTLSRFESGYSRIVLIDDGQLGAEIAPELVIVPFPEHGGAFGGPPADDDAAVAELERLVKPGHTLVAVAWTAGWWLDHYRRFFARLRAAATCVHHDDLVTVYELSQFPAQEDSAEDDTCRFRYVPPPGATEVLGATTFDLRGAHAHDHVFAEIRSGATFYELDLLEHLDATAKRGGVYVDVGANIGNHAIYFARYLADHVIAVEANADVVAVLERNLGLNTTGNWTVIACGAGASDGRGRVVLDEGHQCNVGAARLDLTVAPGDGDIAVRRLDSILGELRGQLAGQRVSFVKIDVEGMELAVLLGARQLLNADHPELSVELADRRDDHEVMKLLIGLGYEDVGSFGWTPTHHFVHRDARARGA